MDKHVIQIVGTAWLLPSSHDGEFVVEYSPASMDAQGHYRKDGTLRTTRSVLLARQFEGAGPAFEYANQANGLRPDGRPNRPLCSYSLLIAPVTDFPGGAIHATAH